MNLLQRELQRKKNALAKAKEFQQQQQQPKDVT
jgi:hypothetical protein